MKQLVITLFALFIGLGFALAPFDAEARRMGGGKSFGMQRSAPAKRMTSPQQQGTTTPASPQKRSWMGPIAGLAAGLGLAALMSHFGMGEQFANMLMIALVAMAAVMLFRYLTRPRLAPGTQYASGNMAPIDSAARFERSPTEINPMSGSTAFVSSYPPGFDAEVFVREAKLNFIRMQAANDAGNIDDIRAFTSPELFAEIRLQLSERGAATQVTDVVNLNADVIECAEENGQLIASVRFHGLINEDATTGTTQFDEIWHLSKPANGQGGWIVAGIQQTN